MFEITINGVKSVHKNKVKVSSLIKNNDYSIVTCKVNNRMRELSYEVEEDCVIEFLDLNDEETTKIYETSLRFLFAMATKAVFPDLEIKFSYYVSRTILAQALNQKSIDEEMTKKIEEKMKQIIKEDYPFVKSHISISQALDFYKKNNFKDKIQLLDYRPEKTVNIYTCNDYSNYFYSYMVYSTAYLSKFNLIYHHDGVIIQYPRSETNGEIPVFKNEKVYGETLKEARKWAKSINAQTVSQVNENVTKGNAIEFIEKCENRHNEMLKELADKITLNSNIKLIAIAGPSSSGKTTFSNRLMSELISRGRKPITLSIDDYYLDRDLIIPDENGKIDLEHINTLDVELFNDHLTRLIKGEEVDIPHFDFKIKRRVKGGKLKINEGCPLIIEGIHALNEFLTSSIKKENKFKIYIAPHIQINLDNHNPISITHYRLIRRIVRDKQFRNSDAFRTLSMWESVRKGEFTWIYENQESADYVFNSELSYEICVLKKFALPILKEIKADNECYVLANKLIKLLKYFVEIDEKLVPNYSLLREFIGESK